MAHVTKEIIYICDECLEEYDDFDEAKECCPKSRAGWEYH